MRALIISICVVAPVGAVTPSTAANLDPPTGKLEAFLEPPYTHFFARFSDDPEDTLTYSWSPGTQIQCGSWQPGTTTTHDPGAFSAHWYHGGAPGNLANNTGVTCSHDGGTNAGNHPGTFQVTVRDQVGNKVVCTKSGPGGGEGTCTTHPVVSDARCGQPGVICGTDDDDHIVGTPNNDVILTGAGNDTVDAGLGNDTVESGPGNDNVTSGPLSPEAEAQIDKDSIDPGAGDDTVEGGVGDDTVTLDPGGTDNISGGTGADTLTVIRATSRFMTLKLFMGEGKDKVEFGFELFLELFINLDTFIGGDLGPGDDELTIDKVADFPLSLDLTGGEGNDTINLSDEEVFRTSVSGAAASGAGSVKVAGGAGNDHLTGSSANDSLLGQAGKDRLAGGPGKDVLNGGPAKDRCNGGPGKDKTKACE